jgi:sec-independent protein translocase protein TatB
MAAEFQGQFQEAMREAEMADLKKSFDEVKEAASGFTSGNLMTSLERDVSKALDIDGIDKPATSNTDAPATSNTDAPATSNTDAQAASTEAPAIEPPVTPTTPEPPTPETFVEASTHAATMEPLAITREVLPEPAPPEAAPAAPDVLKDAKAS